MADVAWLFDHLREPRLQVLLDYSCPEPAPLPLDNVNPNHPVAGSTMTRGFMLLGYFDTL